MSIKTYDRFGIMLDCSRNAVRTVAEVKRFIDVIAKMGYNALELYTEDTYEVEGEPYFGYLRGRYTGKEIQEIDAYAKKQGIELIPCIQTLAHFTNLVRHPAYGPFVDIDDILLVDDSRTYALIENIFATLAKNFSSRLVNIGMDEAWQLGLGKYLKAHGLCNRYDMLLRHLKRVVEIAEKYGFKPHMWSDMFFRVAANGKYYLQDPVEFPEKVFSDMPENIELAYWDYYTEEKAVYDNMFSMHEKFNRDIWFAGGAWTWQGFAPVNHGTLITMKTALQSASEHKVKNVLITMWGDNGAECSIYAVLPSLYAIRQYAMGNFDEQKIKEGFFQLFGLRFDDFMALDMPNRFSYDDKSVQVRCLTKTFLYMDPFMGFLDKTIEEIGHIPYGQYASVLYEAQERSGEYGYIFECLADLCKVLEIKTELGIRTRKAYLAKDTETLRAIVNDYQELQARLRVFRDAFYRLWHKENKPQGWEIQDIRIGGVAQRLATCQQRLTEYLAGELTALEELEEEILPYDLPNHRYELMISMSKITKR